MNREPIVMSAYKQPYDKNYIKHLRQLAQQNVEKIKEKPTLKMLFETVDKCWENPAFVRQTNFKNKDQHYAYVTEYFNSVIDKMDLESYKKMVLQDILNRLEKAENLLESDKILAAAKEHKKQEDAHLKEYNDQLTDLKDRNETVQKDSMQKLTGKTYD